MASVDIVVPCYNYAHFLEDCVASILSQRDVHVRVLILNDASPDNTDDIGKALAASDPRVTYLRNEENLGLIGTANRGLLDWASADYSLLLSADDLLTPGSLARATAVMDAHDDVHLVFGRALLIDDKFQSGALPKDDGAAEYQIVAGEMFVRRNFTHSNPVASPTAVVRTSTQHRLGGYLPQFAHTSDMDMWMRFAAHGAVGAVKNLQAGYRIHGASMSSPKINRAISDRQECFDTCQYFVDAWSDKVPNAQSWLVDLKRRMARDAYWLATQSKFSREERHVCTQFARQIDPDGLLSWQRIKFELKNSLLALKSNSQNPGVLEYIPMESNIYGWWPGEE